MKGRLAGIALSALSGSVYLIASRGADQIEWLTPVAKFALPDVRGRIDQLAADLANGRLLVASSGNDSVEIADVITNNRVGSIPALAGPRGVGYLKAVDRIFVATGGTGTVAAYDATTLRLAASNALGGEAGAVRVAGQENDIWVGYGEGALALLDGNLKKLGEVAVGGHPEAFELESAGTRIFVNVPQRHYVAVVDRRKMTVTAIWPITEGNDNFAMALDETHQRLFVVCQRPARMLVLDTDSGVTVASMQTVGDAEDVSYDPIHGRVYVSGGEGSIAIYEQQSADEYRSLGTVPTVAGARTSLFVAEWNLLFVAVRERGPQAAEIRVYRP
jgi:YVTN family beta-propeller protein